MMNEVVAVRMANWAAIIKQRNKSGLSVKQWCSENNIPEGAYYYWLKKLRAKALEVAGQPNGITEEKSGNGFLRIADEGTRLKPNSEVALRIKKGDALVEVSNDASDGILTLLKEVLSGAL